MSSHSIDRRDFLTRTARAGLAVCSACLCARAPLFAGGEDDSEAKPVPDPKKLEYCGYDCPEDCKFLKATKSGDLELKKEVWKTWEIEERFGVPFDPDLAVCHGCKAPGKPEGIVVKRCDVRACAREKGVDCCITCGDLAECDKDLWRRFPKFKQQVIEMRKRYLAEG